MRELSDVYLVCHVHKWRMSRAQMAYVTPAVLSVIIFFFTKTFLVFFPRAGSFPMTPSCTWRLTRRSLWGLGRKRWLTSWNQNQKVTLTRTLLHHIYRASIFQVLKNLVESESKVLKSFHCVFCSKLWFQYQGWYGQACLERRHWCICNKDPSEWYCI